MKVLMISEYFYPHSKGGGEISAFLLAKELAKSGLEIHVLTSHFNGLKKEEVIEKVKIHRKLKTGKNPSFLIDNIKRRFLFEKSLLKELEKLDEKENFDIIHCMNITSLVAVKLKDKIKKKFILHVNSPVLFCPKGTLMYKDKCSCDKECTLSAFFDCYLHSSLLGKFELRPYLKYNPFFLFALRRSYDNYKKLIKKFDYYFPISEFMKEMLLKVGIPKDKISVIYNIIELDKFSKLKNNWHNPPRILYLGEYSMPKGPQILIDALKGIKVPYEANFYGEGVLKKYLIGEVKKNKLNTKINEKVSYEIIPKILEEHDIIVFPSLVGEAYGRVVLEAAAAGKVIIASNVGGVGEDVQSVNFFSLGNSEELRKILRTKLTKKVIRKEKINSKLLEKNNVLLVKNTYESIQNA